MNTYLVGLAIASVLVALAEAVRPWRREQGQLRRWLWSDALHLVFNGHYFGVVLYAGARHVAPAFDGALKGLGLYPYVYRNVATGWPWWLQAIVLVILFDFAQWTIHRLLHAVPWLWTFHKIHHSVVDGEMDWIVSFRFHWFEAVVYKGLQYVPLAFFGFGETAVLIHAIGGTVIGHLNHANLDVGRGLIRYVLNTPRMHLWHHAADGPARNFGVILSVWDWIFGTAHLPDEPPARIGFPGVERLPRSFFAHLVWPLVPRRDPADEVHRAA